MLHQLSPDCQASCRVRQGSAAPQWRRARRHSAARFARLRRFLPVEPEVHPVRSPELDRMLCPVRSVAAAHGIGRTVLFASPTDAFGMAGMLRNLWGHGEMLCAHDLACIDKNHSHGVSTPVLRHAIGSRVHLRKEPLHHRACP